MPQRKAAPQRQVDTVTEPQVDTPEVKIFAEAESSESPPASVDDIRLCAYQKWEDAGRPECDGVDFWLEAESELS
ncbi:MAG: DUF2934 domain-containing protein [Planctomycetaceae bacterium]|nr:DUF2934 domain-containing protein [Planctomycetaceae bacterium]